MISHAYRHEAASFAEEDRVHEEIMYRLLNKVDADLAKIDTPYGTLVKSWQVANIAPGGTAAAAAEPDYFKIEYVCPMALLYHLCSMSAAFLRKLQAACRAVGRIVIYFDDVTPGNIKRPDSGRSYMAVYWTLLDFPAHILSTESGWFPLSYIPKDVYRRCRGGVSHLCTLFLRAFFPSTGYSCSQFAIMTESTAVMISMKFTCWLTDGDAFPRIADSKSTSGTKPCPKCKTVLGRCSPEDIPEDSPHVHVTCGDPSKFIEWEPAEVIDVQRHLAAQHAAVAAGLITAEQFHQEEQLLGYKFSPYGLLASDMAVVADVPRSLYMDWMHTLVSSGGVAQYELNQFLRRIVRLAHRSRRSAMFATLDDFKKAIKFPAREPKVPLKLESRVVDKDSAHVKMFAGECLHFVFVIAAYTALHLMPEGLLPDEAQCFLLLSRILSILRSGPKAVARIPLLRRLVSDHHELFLRLYPQCAHIKPHLLFHIPDSMDLFKVNLSCFTAERAHRQSKRIGMWAFKQWCLTMLRRHLRRLCQDVSKDDFFAEHKFVNLMPLQLRFGRRTLADAVHGRNLELQLLNFTEECKALITPTGQIAPGDLAMFHGSGEDKLVGFVKQLLKRELDGSAWCLVMLCPLIAGNCYSFGDQMLLIPAVKLINAVPFFPSQERDRLWILASADLM
jgi:hypothetical protein